MTLFSTALLAIGDLAMSWGLSLSITGFVFLVIGAGILTAARKKPSGPDKRTSVIASGVAIGFGGLLFVIGIIVLITG